MDEIDRVITYFNNNFASYDNYHEIDDYLNTLLQTRKGKKTILDIGGGGGAFASLLLNSYPDIEVTVVDPSEKFLETIKDTRINKIKGNLPDQLDVEGTFDFIFCQAVFHHIVGTSIKKSKNLFIDSLYYIKSHLNPHDGYFIVREVYYDGYIYNVLPRTLIFYLLKFQRKLRVTFPFEWFKEDLLVCFYTRNELKNILNKCGFEIVSIKEVPWKLPILFKLAGVKECGWIYIYLKLK